MTKPKLLAFGVIVLVCLTAGLFRQHQQLQRIRADNARLLADGAELGSLRDEISRLRQVQADPSELERLRQAQAELLRLRGEASQLRRQLKDVEQSKRVISVNDALTPAPAAPDQIVPVETWTANVTVNLTSKQTLVTGGWLMANDKRTLILIEPTFTNGADSIRQVIIQARILESPDELLPTELRMKCHGRQSSTWTVINPKQSELLIKQLGDTAGVDLLSLPQASTLDGRQAQFKAVNVKIISGEPYELGPTVDVVPHISPDGTSVDLRVVAQLRYQFK